MKKIVLNAKPRKVEEKEFESGWVKGVVYGPELKENKIVWVRAQEFNKVYQESGRSTLIDLMIEGEKEELSVLFHEMQYDGLTDELTHIDFYKVKMGEKIDTTIELNFVDEAPAVKEHGAIIVKGQSSLDVRCFPRHLVSEIEVSLASLKEFEDSIYVKDIKVPAEIEVTTNADTAVISLSRPRTAEDLEELDEKVEMDVDNVEVEKGKEAEEDEAEGEDKPKSEEVKPEEEKK